MDEKQLEKLEEVLKKIEAYETLGGDVPTTKEVVELFEAVLKVVKELKDTLLQKVEDSSSEMSDKYSEAIKVVESLEERMGKKNAKMSEEMDEMAKKIFQSIAEVKSLISPITDLSPLEKRVGEVEKKIPTIPDEITPEVVKNKLESLEGEERLKKEAIKGLNEELKEIRSLPRGGGGARGFQLYTDGTKRGQVSMINIIPGTGVSLAYSSAFGRNDITISAAASSSILDFTGTVNDSNVTFITTAEPSIVVINGASYRATGGPITWTYVAGTITLSSPVGTGGNIYGIA